MPSIQYLKTHRTWEDWLAIAAGVAIWATTKLNPGGIDRVVYWNTTLTGVVVLILASIIYETHARSREIAEAACGLWLLASPFIFEYAGSGALRYWHFGLGALVALLAVLELIQDWSSSDTP